MRGYFHHLVRGGGLLTDTSGVRVRLVYAAERKDFDLATINTLQGIQDNYPAYFLHYIVLNQPPLGWKEGVGFVNEDRPGGSCFTRTRRRRASSLLCVARRSLRW